MSESRKVITVLVVDDSPVGRMIVRKLLESEKEICTNITEAFNGHDGFEKFKACHPDLVITDYNMPVMNGMELISRIKKEDPVKQIPVILLTGEDNSSRIDSFSDYPCGHYIKKSSGQKQLKELLLPILNQIVKKG